MACAATGENGTTRGGCSWGGGEMSGPSSQGGGGGGGGARLSLVSSAPGGVYVPKSQRPCPAQAQYGFCKYAGAGCEYMHEYRPPSSNPYQSEGSSQPIDQSHPSQMRPGGRSALVEAMPFKPSTLSASTPAFTSATSMGNTPYGMYPQQGAGGVHPMHPSTSYRPKYASYEQDPSSQSVPRMPSNRSYHDSSDGSGYFGGMVPKGGQMQQHAHAQHSAPPAGSQQHARQPIMAYPQRESRMTAESAGYAPRMPSTSQARSSRQQPGQSSSAYFYSQPASSDRGGAMYNPYVTDLPHTSSEAAGRRSLQSFFMPENLRKQFHARSADIIATADPEDARVKDLPQTLHRYYSLVPLEEPREKASRSWSASTGVYKGISSSDGLPYLIRRVEGLRINADYTMRVADVWRQVHHPNIVSLREVFQAKELSGLYVAYDYHPCSQTLEQQHLFQPAAPVSEELLWSYVCQLVSALRTIHAAGLACRIVNLQKVIVTGKHRIRISGVGIRDIVSFDLHSKTAQCQQEDLVSLGKLILSLACGSVNAVSAPAKSLEYVAAHFSNDLVDLLRLLLSQNIKYPSADELARIVSRHNLRQNEYLHDYTDLLERELAKEVACGRMFRLIAKLGFINERPEFGMDPRWSETGDRYLLKLFRDYLFHQVYEDGSPAVDLGHVTDTLNKLDVGSPERLVLMSRDEKSILVVSYKDVKRCMEQAFDELLSKHSDHGGIS
eukprot:TRINITY_DN94_c2_g1_i1.p1 TRINITY_DN94_c2_g1~~TRINITY_DN94_c2_g1_i1.p1  ORF type:complete len:724 (+),score=139.12 TRINITY_DN94_c2_g1_i1:3-2174(+)